MDPPTPEIYSLPLPAALPISAGPVVHARPRHEADPRRPARPRDHQAVRHERAPAPSGVPETRPGRSEEHTSELQSQSNLVCRLLLEKKKKQPMNCERLPSPDT